MLTFGSYFLGLGALDLMDFAVLDVRVDFISKLSSLIIANEFFANLRTSLLESLE